MTVAAPIRVLVVEDSPTQREFLRRSLEADGDIVVVGQAASAVNAVAIATQAQPDVVTMDLDIPGGGLTAIARIMASSPRPILLLSGQLLGPRSPEAVDALGAGAVGVLVKPRRWDDESQRLLRGRIRTLRRVRATAARAERAPRRRTATVCPVIGIGASTGGPSALAHVLGDLAPSHPPVLCVQHIDGRQTDGLVRWLAATSRRDVRMAIDGATLEPGVVLVGPGGCHLTLGTDRRVVLEPGGSSLHAPSLDRLLLSLAEVSGAHAVGCVLTGMGSDGAEGMLALSDAGGFTIAQDAPTSVVYGMAGAAVAKGAIRRVLPLDSIGTAITRATRGMR